MTSLPNTRASLLLVVFALVASGPVGCSSPRATRPVSVRFAGPVTGEAHLTARQFVLASEATLGLQFVETRTERTVLLVGIRPDRDDLDAAVERVQEEAARAERAVATVLAMEPEEDLAPFPLIVLPDRAALRRFAQTWDGVVGVGHSGGYYVEGSTIDPDGLPSDRAHAVVARGEVGVMAHEMAHGRLALMVKEQHTDGVVPAWLDEGIAEQVRLRVLSKRRRDQVTERAHALCAALVKVGDRRARVRSVLARRSLAPSDRSGYALSLDLVSWLRGRLGEADLRELAIETAGPGADPVRALERALEQDTKTIEKSWHDTLRPN